VSTSTLICRGCSEAVTLPSAEVMLIMHTETSGLFAFDCPKCQHHTVLPCGRLPIQVLLRAGVVPLAGVPAATPPLPPREHAGPRINATDFCVFVALLDQHDELVPFAMMERTS